MRRTTMFAAALLATAPALAKSGHCVLEVNHKTYLDGPCEIDIFDARGSFTIGVSDTNRSPYFAYVDIDDDGAKGFWNETPESNHAHTDLGALQHRGACWENARARVCAYK